MLNSIRNYCFILTLLIVLGCQTSGYKWYSGTVEKAKSKAGTKLILLEFYTDTWPACHRLDAETFSDLTVQSFSRSNLISLKLDANDETGNKYFKDYNCEGVPHLLFVDQEGNEVDRIIGFLPPGEYLARIQDIRNNKHTLSDTLANIKMGRLMLNWLRELQWNMKTEAIQIMRKNFILFS